MKGPVPRTAAAVHYRELLCGLLAQGERILARDRALTDREIHDLRRLLKRCRAIVRLLRTGIGKAEFRRLNAALRRVARPFAPLRDARVVREALAALLREKPAAIARATATRLRRRLSARPRPAPPDNRALRRGLSGVARHVAQLPAESMDDAVPVAGVRRVYRSGRRSLARARTREDEALHEWRKQTKYLLNQLVALQGRSPRAPVARLVRQAERLAERLGIDHDLAMLARFVADPAGELSPHARAELLWRIHAKRQRLQRASLRAGARLYERKPAAFVRGLAIRTGG
jgi:hypothetical protein